MEPSDDELGRENEALRPRLRPLEAQVDQTHPPPRRRPPRRQTPVRSLLQGPTQGRTESPGALLPDACLNCGGPVVETAVVHQDQTEIPASPSSASSSSSSGMSETVVTPLSRLPFVSRPSRITGAVASAKEQDDAFSVPLRSSVRFGILPRLPPGVQSVLVLQVLHQPAVRIVPRPEVVQPPAKLLRPHAGRVGKEWEIRKGLARFGRLSNDNRNVRS